MWVLAGLVAAALGISAGIGFGKLLDNVMAKTGGAISTLGGLIPQGSLDVAPPDPVTKKTNWLGIIIIAVLGAIGIMIVRWVGKKLNVKLLKR
jgi:hypothetical protein